MSNPKKSNYGGGEVTVHIITIHDFRPGFWVAWGEARSMAICSGAVVALHLGGREGDALNPRTCQHPIQSLRFLHKWTWPQPLRILLRTARTKNAYRTSYCLGDYADDDDLAGMCREYWEPNGQCWGFFMMVYKASPHFRQQQYKASLHIYARVCVYVLLKHKGWNFKRVPLGKLFVKPPKEWSGFYTVSGQERHAIFWTKAAKHNAG
jgi:hypothetical protein